MRPQVRPTGWRVVVGKENGGDIGYALYAGSTNSRPGVSIRARGIEINLAGGTRLAAGTWPPPTTARPCART